MTELEDFLKTHDAGDILDIACGSGAFTKRLAEGCKSYRSIIGLDIKADAEDDFLAAVQGHDVSFVAASIHDYLETSPAYDTISVSNALHHLEQVGDVLTRAAGRLREGGTFIVNEMHRDDLTPSQETQFLQHRFLADLHRASGEFHRQAFARSEIHGFLEEAGLQVRHAFENDNRQAEVTKEPGRVVERARAAIEKAYPHGAPSEVTAQLENLAARSADIGSSPPPQLTFVCERVIGV